MATEHSDSHWDSPETTVSELASPAPGAASPFGEDVEFPLPADMLRYDHPTPAERPNLPVDN